MNPERRDAECVACGAQEQSIWAGLSDASLEPLFEKRRRRSLKRGSVIFSQGDDCEGVHCLETGNVLLSSVDAVGSETAFCVVTRGECFGYRAYFADEPHAATARALSACRVCLIPDDAMSELLSANPVLNARFLRTLARDQGPRNGLWLRGSHLPVRIRLIHLLLVLEERFATPQLDGSLLFELPLTRRDLAAMVGISPETVTRTIREFEDEGLASFRGRRVVVMEPGRLRRIARFDWRPR